jgi:anaerobic C4-dicarboxylate transporter
MMMMIMVAARAALRLEVEAQRLHHSRIWRSGIGATTLGLGIGQQGGTVVQFGRQWIR